MSAFDLPTSPSLPAAKSRSPGRGARHPRSLTGSAVGGPRLKTHRSPGSLPPTTVPLKMRPARKRLRSVNRDRKGKRTVGSVYARHIPESHLLIDYVEFFRYAHTSPSKAAAMAIVVSFLDSYRTTPILDKGTPLLLRFPEWDHVGPEVRWYFYGYAARKRFEDFTSEGFTHAITINLPDELIHLRLQEKGHGPGRIIGQEIIRGLFAKLYERAGVPLTYAYAIEMHQKPDDEGGKLQSDSYDATILLQVPDQLHLSD